MTPRLLRVVTTSRVAPPEAALQGQALLQQRPGLRGVASPLQVVAVVVEGQPSAHVSPWRRPSSMLSSNRASARWCWPSFRSALARWEVDTTVQRASLRPWEQDEGFLQERKGQRDIVLQQEEQPRLGVQRACLRPG